MDGLRRVVICWILCVTEKVGLSLANVMPLLNSAFEQGLYI